MLTPGDIGPNLMKRFKSQLIAGAKVPYSSWVFVVVPEAVGREWNKHRCDVRGSINGEPFRGTVAKGEGVHRMPVTQDFLRRVGVTKGTIVNVCMELDPEPRNPDIPAELEAVLAIDASLADLFGAMAPSHRRAWASYVGEAKLSQTRARRAEKARDGIRARKFPGQ